MMTALILLCIAITASDIGQIALLPTRWSYVWCVIVGIITTILTLLFTELSRQEVADLFLVKNIVIGEFVEVAIFMAFIFSKNKLKVLQSYYPGFMIFIPLSLLSIISTRLLVGIDFYIAGLIAGCVATLLLIGLNLLLRSLAIDKSTLYLLCIATIIINIITFGMT
jgi:hypothetical protein